MENFAYPPPIYFVLLGGAYGPNCNMTRLGPQFTDTRFNVTKLTLMYIDVASHNKDLYVSGAIYSH